jgi:hypothetical protein
MDLVHPHLSQRHLLPVSGPSLQIPQVDRSHRAGRQPVLPPHLPRRRALTGLAHQILEAFAERRLTPQLLDFSALIPHPGHRSRCNSIITVV